MTDLNELKELARKADDGPWFSVADLYDALVIQDITANPDNDADFIHAASPAAITALISEVERLRVHEVRISKALTDALFGLSERKQFYIDTSHSATEPSKSKQQAMAVALAEALSIIAPLCNAIREDRALAALPNQKDDVK